MRFSFSGTGRGRCTARASTAASPARRSASTSTCLGSRRPRTSPQSPFSYSGRQQIKVQEPHQDRSRRGAPCRAAGPAGPRQFTKAASMVMLFEVVPSPKAAMFWHFLHKGPRTTRPRRPDAPRVVDPRVLPRLVQVHAVVALAFRRPPLSLRALFMVFSDTKKASSRRFWSTARRRAPSYSSRRPSGGGSRPLS